ncbi:MAG: LytTR family DNA-binding domain-containing protein [Bacteroidota bacterium]
MLSCLSKLNTLLRQHLQISQNLNQKLQKELTESPISKEEVIDLEIENREVRFNRKNLLFISSEGNYLAFHFLKDHTKTSALYRGRLKKLEEDLENYPEFFRCHRSLIININHVESTKGNSQGLSVKLLQHDDFLPVSRPNIKELRRQMNRNWGLNSPFIT